ncbi:uncharacterized protein LOC124442071 [Xenia sp. Carnegie-2017]|uniref:uncharacterized protein LOC124442071 n=1 Tax=Xenia sp. Carnegie-2017 TaxID=2897299 RepID=UPI001F03846F|nr:uncharacterized protein LOC124442071 [Xenia sp. Carnegie-2017]
MTKKQRHHVDGCVLFNLSKFVKQKQRHHVNGCVSLNLSKFVKQKQRHHINGCVSLNLSKFVKKKQRHHVNGCVSLNLSKFVKMQSREKINKFYLQEILTDVTKKLVDFFIQEWNTHYKKSLGEWENTNVSGQKMFNVEISKDLLKTYFVKISKW